MLLSKLHSGSNLIRRKAEKQEPLLRIGTHSEDLPVNSRSSLTVLPQECLEHIYSYLLPKEKIYIGRRNRYLHNISRRQILEHYRQTPNPHRWSFGFRNYYDYHRLDLTRKNLLIAQKLAKLPSHVLIIVSAACISSLIITRGPLNYPEWLVTNYQGLRLCTTCAAYTALSLFGLSFIPISLLILTKNYPQGQPQAQSLSRFFPNVLSFYTQICRLQMFRYVAAAWMAGAYNAGLLANLANPHVYINLGLLLTDLFTEYGRSITFTSTDILHFLIFFYIIVPMGARFCDKLFLAVKALADSCSELEHEHLLTTNNLRLVYHYSFHGYLPLSPPMKKVQATVQQALRSRQINPQDAAFINGLESKGLIDTLAV